MPHMNKKAAIIIISVLLVLVIGGGTSAYFLLRDKGVAAVVNGVKITDQKVTSEFDKTVTQYEAQGMPLQPEQKDQVRNSIIDNLIIREVLIQSSSTYEITDEEIDTQIASYKNQFNSDEEFENALTSQGFEVDSFRDVVAQDMKIQKYIDDNVKKETDATEKEILAFYNDNPSYFTEPERIHASHILVKKVETDSDENKAKALEKIERIRQELKDGADFAEEAKKESEDPSGPNGGDLGEITRGQMVGDFESVAFALPEGEVSGIVETQFGYHIIKVHERFPETNIPLNDVKESIRSYLIEDKNKKVLNSFLDDLKAKADIRIPGKKKEV